MKNTLVLNKCILSHIDGTATHTRHTWRLASSFMICSHAAMRWFDDETEPPPFLRALEETRRLATREGWHYRHVQAIIVAIDQYAEAATGNRDFFLNKPLGARQADVP